MIHILIGNTGAGKTTYSHQLKEKVDGILFFMDIWNATLFLPYKKEDDELEWFLERIERAEKLIQEQLFQLYALLSIPF
jgi:predicted kinase